MALIVVDASVTVKWFDPSPDETDSEKALDLLSAVKNGDVSLCQPPHWLAEVVAVLARLSPATAREDIGDLYEIRFRRMESKGIYSAACTLSCELNHHLFDTLYHAVALTVGDALLVTADERYYNKARQYGSISLLSDFSVSPL